MSPFDESEHVAGAPPPARRPLGERLTPAVVAFLERHPRLLVCAPMWSFAYLVAHIHYAQLRHLCPFDDE